LESGGQEHRAPQATSAPPAAHADAPPLASHVRLGVHCLQITPALAQTDHLPVHTGVRVVTIEAGSVAEAFGIKVGDVLLKYGDRPLSQIGDLTAAIGATTPGAEVAITIWRRSGRAVAEVRF
jgi:serine protease Do